MGIRPTDESIKALLEQPIPQNSTQLCSFLGSLTFHRKHIPNLQAICASLHRLLGKGVQWKWTSSDDKIFKQLKAEIATASTLVHYDPNMPIILATDASEHGLGAILLHKFQDGSERMIAAASRTLADAEKRYAPIDREALAIMFGVNKFHQYVYGRKFTIRTDHKPLERIFGANKEIPKLAASRLTRWAITLSGYQYEIEYKPGKDNVAADALSRLPLPDKKASEFESSAATAVCQIRQINIEELPITKQLLQSKTHSDPTLIKVIQYIEHGWPEKRNIPTELIPFYEKRNKLHSKSAQVYGKIE